MSSRCEQTNERVAQYSTRPFFHHSAHRVAVPNLDAPIAAAGHVEITVKRTPLNRVDRHVMVDRRLPHVVTVALREEMGAF